MANAIEIRQVSKSFGAVRALDDLSLDVRQGEMFGLIGHNGAGKSTLFKLMLGLAAADAGSIGVAGVAVGGAAFREARRRIGYLPESFVTYDNLTGLEVLTLFANLKRVAPAACGPLLERVGLADAAGRRVRGYSKGMRQRLGFAQALLGDPALIFLDEPTNGLDPEAIHAFYRTLREVQAQGTTVVITSHILAEIEQRVDRLVVLAAGRIAAQGTLAQLRQATALPSVLQVRTRDGATAALEAALCGVPGLGFVREHGGASISCPAERKMAALAAIAALPGEVLDVAIREPSLEDLFLGYGGAHAGQH